MMIIPLKGYSYSFFIAYCISNFIIIIIINKLPPEKETEIQNTLYKFGKPTQNVKSVN
jgi:hypothetical protein